MSRIRQRRRKQHRPGSMRPTRVRSRHRASTVAHCYLHQTRIGGKARERGSMARDANPFAGLNDYEVDHLLDHLSVLDREGVVHRLLRLTVDGLAPHVSRNAWYELKRARGRAEAYFGDLAKARRFARDRVDLALEARYALLGASARTIAERTVYAFGPDLVRSRRWTPERVIEYARQSSDTFERSRSLLLIAPLVDVSRRVELARDAAAPLSEAQSSSAFDSLAGRCTCP